MGANANTQQEKRFFKLIQKAEKCNLEKKQAICEQRKNVDKYEIVGWYSSLSGTITSLKIKEVEYQGKVSKIVFLELTDSDGVFVIDFSFSKAAFTIINSLLSLDFTRPIELSAWIKDGMYVNTGVKYLGGEKVKWAIEINDQPKPIEYSTPSGKKENDYTNVTDFWIAKVEGLLDKAVRSNFIVTAQSPSSPSAIEQPKSLVDDDNSDLPF